MGSIATANSPLKLPPEQVIFGQSDSMRLVRAKIEKLANANVPVLIQGESGTGKEIIAKMIHCRSPWSMGPFVKVNCPAIPGTLLESELFGYEKGAFTGAYGTKPGRVELAHRGTLFLDEIAELDPALQAKLLQVLQDGQFCRIGAQEDKKVEVRMVCATNRNLQDEIDAGNFRQDLFFRINVLNVHLAPLRERREDLPDLVAYFLDTYNERYNCQARPLSSQFMKRYVILGSEETITSELLTCDTRPFTPEIPLDGSVSLKKVTRQAVRELERQVILRSLQANNWNRKRVARALSISYRALLYKIRDAGLSSNRARRMAAAAEMTAGMQQHREAA